MQLFVLVISGCHNTYEIFQKKAIWVSEAADLQINIMSQCSNPNISDLNPQYVLDDQIVPNLIYVQTMHYTDNIVINIQLLYNSSTPMEPKL